MALWSNIDEEAGKPKYLSDELRNDQTVSDKASTFGVNWDETMWNPGMITDIAIVQGGSNYTETPNVTIASAEEGAGATAEATIADGKVTAITIIAGGDGGYNAVPAVYIDVPRRTIPTGNITISTELLIYGAHGLQNGDAVIYRSNGGTAIAGLTDGTTYYAHIINVDNFKLYDTAEHAIAGGATGLINLTGTGNDDQYFDLVAPAGVTATAVAVLGTGSEVVSGDGGASVPEGYAQWVSGEQHITHAGWVKKTVGTGGRAGRVQYETLVAMGSMIGDASGDTAFPSGD